MARTSNNAIKIDDLLQESNYLSTVAPYQIPENWCWTSLKRITKHQSGNSKLIKGKLPSERGEGLYPGYSASGQDVFCPGYEHEGEAVIVSAVGARCGKAFLANGKWNAIANTHIVYPTDAINVKFMFLHLNDEEWWVKSGSAQPFVVVNESLERPFPLPPLAEQQRIVERIESLFAKLDEAKEKAQAVIDGYEDRKAAILHKAFTGELTEEWRKENGVDLNSWSLKTVDSICYSLKYGTSKKSEGFGPVVVIRMGNLQQGEIDWTDLAFTTDEEDIEKYHLEPNDVLFNRTNSAALVGKTSIYRGEHPAIYAGYLIKLDYDHEIVTGDFLNYALNTQSAKEYCNSVKTDGVNQSNINAKKIGAYRFALPSFKEQKKIVEILKKLLEKEQKTKEVAEQVIVRIDSIKKSILARAFRGKLGTNDPTDEPALELLKKIIKG